MDASVPSVSVHDLRKWSLWRFPSASSSQIELSSTVRLTTSVADVPELLGCPRKSSWDSSHRRVWIQTDNQDVEQIFAGLYYTKVSDRRPLGIHIARFLGKLWDSGCRPRVETGSFVEWDPRKYNTLADDAANLALNGRGDWMLAHWDRISHARAADRDCRICFDGAMRKTGCSCAGLTVIAYYDGGH